MRVGLTGGVASGKSTVSAILAELGAVVIDADLLAREVVAKGSDGLAEIVAEFGSDVLTQDGELDRPAMGALVFADPQRRQALEAIIHPRVRRRGREIEAEAAPGALVVHDIPLLAETGQAANFDAVLVVDVPTEVQIERMVGLRGMTRADAEARVAAQATRERRLAIATHVIDNTGNARRPPRACRGGRRGLGRAGVNPPAPFRAHADSWSAGQAARSGSPSLRSFCSASRSSWRTRSAEMPCLAPMSASLCWRPSVRP